MNASRFRTVLAFGVAVLLVLLQFVGAPTAEAGLSSRPDACVGNAVVVELPSGSSNISGTSSNQTVVPNANIVVDDSADPPTVTITPSGSPGSAEITIAFTFSDIQAFATIDVIAGSAANNSLNGTPFDEVIFGLGGADRLVGSGGSDLLCGGDGNDALSGSLGNDTLEGQGGNDTMLGGPGDDRLLGGPGNDLMFGDYGFDELTGGTGADGFRGGPDIDIYNDFNPGEGDTTDGT